MADPQPTEKTECQTKYEDSGAKMMPGNMTIRGAVTI